MLINRKTLAGIKEGRITVAFRKWKRPTVKVHSTLRTEAGVLAIDAVEEISRQTITPADAQAAGFSSLEELQNWLEDSRPGTLYKIQLRYLEVDPRETLRAQSTLSATEIQSLTDCLHAIDKRNSGGPTCAQLMAHITLHPGIRASDLAHTLGLPSETLKRRVRALKELGLTESLRPGYRLSPRGHALATRKP